MASLSCTAISVGALVVSIQAEDPNRMNRLAEQSLLEKRAEKNGSGCVPSRAANKRTMLEKLCKNRFSDETVDAVPITRISASSPTRDRNRSLAIPQNQSTQI
jgi:hypothetical protein